MPASFERLQYIEQRNRQDLEKERVKVMHEPARIKPVVVHGSLRDQESLLLAREMGYSGAALKARKDQRQALLIAAARKPGCYCACRISPVRGVVDPFRSPGNLNSRRRRR